MPLPPLPDKEVVMAKRRSKLHGREGIAGWVFTAPMIVILGVFLFVPILWRSGSA
jgi:ABC-type sugar transport system permease subunit